MKTVKIGIINEAAVPDAAPTNIPLTNPARMGRIKIMSNCIRIWMV